MSDERENRVGDRAHSLWKDEGGPEGGALHHWLMAEHESDGATSYSTASGAHPDDVDEAAGPSHGKKDFGGHDAETEGAAAAGVGGQKHPAGAEPKQAGTDEAEVGEKRAPSGLPKS